MRSPLLLFDGIGMDIDIVKQHFIIIQDGRQSSNIDYPLFDIFMARCAP